MDGALEWFSQATSTFVVFVSSLSAMTLITAAAPGFVQRERKAARSGSRRCFTWGGVFVVNTILLSALLALVDGIVGNVIALALLVLLLVISLSGLAAVATEVGGRVLSLADRYNASTLLRLSVGTTVLFTTAVIPVFGWLVFASGLLMGIGSFLEAAIEDYRPRGARIERADAVVSGAVR